MSLPGSASGGPDPAGQTRAKPARVPGLAVAAAGTLLALVLFTGPLSSTPTLSRLLGADAAQQSWILSSTSLGLAVALIASGSLGDEWGRRRVFLLGTMLGTAGSLLCFAAAAVPPGAAAAVFIAGRVVQGLGAAAMISCSAALIAAGAADAVQRTKAMGVWGAAVSLGIALGPMLGAITSDAGIWYLAYAVMAVGGAALAIWGRLRLAESKAAEPRPVDWTGALLLAAALALILTGLTEGRRGWGQWGVLAALAAGGLLLLVFGWQQWRGKDPMLDLRIFRLPGLLGASVAAFAMGAGAITMMSYASVILLQDYGLPAVVAAMCLAVWAVVGIFASLLARRLPHGFEGPGRFAVGFLLCVVGFLPWAFLRFGAGLLLPVLGLVVAGAGTGLVNATLGREAVAHLAARQAGMGSGLNNTVRYLGSAIGVTVFGVLATAGLGARAATIGTSAAAVEGWDRAVWACLGVMLLAVLLVLCCGRAMRIAERAAVGTVR